MYSVEFLRTQTTQELVDILQSRDDLKNPEHERIFENNLEQYKVLKTEANISHGIYTHIPYEVFSRLQTNSILRYEVHNVALLLKTINELVADEEEFILSSKSTTDTFYGYYIKELSTHFVSTKDFESYTGVKEFNEPKGIQGTLF